MKAGDKMCKYHLKKIAIFSLTIIIIAGTLLLLSCRAGGGEDGLETFEAIRGNIVQTVSTSGNVDSRYSNNYSLQTSGTVTRSLEKGDAFNKGDILIELNSDRTQLLIKQAEENIKISQTSLELAKMSYQQALDSNHIAIQLAETNTEQAELASENAFKALENANNLASKSIGDSAKAQSQSSKDAAEGAYEQSVLSQSTAYWSNLSSMQAAEAQIATVVKNIEQAELQLSLAEISYELMVLDSDDHIIYAPYDGIVLSSAYKTGEYAGPGIPAIEIASSEFIIISEVNETDIINMDTGQQAIIGLDAYYLDELTGEIIEISPVSTNIGGVVSYKITVRPEVPDGIKLFHGLSASLDIITSDLESVIYIPIQSIREEEGRQYVDILMEDGSIERTEIETGIFNYDFIEIRSGLSEGDIVIVSGLE
jgi:multidrug resistance efflux pump